MKKKKQGFYPDIVNAVPSLRDRTLEKHMIECMDIARVLLGVFDEHKAKKSAVKNWKGYEPFLVKRYIREMVEELCFRDCDRKKIYLGAYTVLLQHEKVEKIRIKTPEWLYNDFVDSHSKYIKEKIG